MSLFLLETKYLPSSLLKINDVLNVVSEIKNVIAHGIERDKSKEELIKNFAETIVDIDADRLLVDWNLSRDKWF